MIDEWNSIIIKKKRFYFMYQKIWLIKLFGEPMQKASRTAATSATRFSSQSISKYKSTFIEVATVQGKKQTCQIIEPKPVRTQRLATDVYFNHVQDYFYFPSNPQKNKWEL